jgi:hypothetical protein
MGGASPPEMPPFHHAHEAFPLGNPDYIHPVPYFESFHGYLLSDLKRSGIAHAEFAQIPEGGDLGFLEVILQRLGQPLGVPLFKTQLHGTVPIPFRGLDLNHGAGAGFNHSHGHNPAVFMEDLAHAQLFADDAF